MVLQQQFWDYHNPIMQSLQVLVLLTSVLMGNGSGLQYDPVDNYFPSCVAVDDIYPDLGSTLKPVQDQLYSIQITFSKPILRDSRTRFLLTPLLHSEGGMNAVKVMRWRGSKRKIALFFNTSKTSINTL